MNEKGVEAPFFLLLFALVSVNHRLNPISVLVVLVMVQCNEGALLVRRIV